MGISSFEFKMAQILMAIEDDPDAPRTARFRCCVAVAKSGEQTQIFESRKEGEIVPPRGERGFGYDPIFLVPELGKTYAELEPEHKNRISHRGIVLREAGEYLRSRWN
jgi:XTP/dITP diphosphohydrolase